jgi:hypothetical protein
MSLSRLASGCLQLLHYPVDDHAFLISSHSFSESLESLYVCSWICLDYEAVWCKLTKIQPRTQIPRTPSNSLRSGIRAPPRSGLCVDVIQPWAVGREWRDICGVRAAASGAPFS